MHPEKSWQVRVGDFALLDWLDGAFLFAGLGGFLLIAACFLVSAGRLLLFCQSLLTRENPGA